VTSISRYPKRPPQHLENIINNTFIGAALSAAAPFQCGQLASATDSDSGSDSDTDTSTDSDTGVRTVRAKPVPGKIKSCADVADSAAAAPLTKLKFWVWESGGGGWKLRGAGGLATKSAKVHKSKVFEIGAQGEN